MWALLATGFVALTVMVTPASASSPAGGSTTICLDPGQRAEQERTVRVAARVGALLLAHTPSYLGPCFAYGEARTLGDGTVRAYVQTDRSAPRAVGVVFPRSAMGGLPSAPHDGHNCYDVDGNGAIDVHHECVGGHEHELSLPETAATPFKWVLANWNPVGHHPPGIYNVPHFDFHFYMQSLAERNAIGMGPCAELVSCGDFERATVPVPDAYRPQDHVDVGAVQGAMGNHLLDLTGPEFNGEPFTHTFIYGAFDGSISFMEPMITTAWFDDLYEGRRQNRCFPMKLPQAWEESGWYPTEYCVRYRPNRSDFTVSLEGFVYRTAT
ncbi:MAG: hypothetical protein ACR2L8_14380 [Solirubrobacteraceae bacterium]